MSDPTENSPIEYRPDLGASERSGQSASYVQPAGPRAFCKLVAAPLGDDGLMRAADASGQIAADCRSFAPHRTRAAGRLARRDASRAVGLEVGVLGALVLRVDGQEVGTNWRSIKALEVLAYLAVRGARGAHREEVIEAVWPERRPDKGRMLLRSALSEIRRRLEPERTAGEPSRFLATCGGRVRLVATVDVAAVRADGHGGFADEALALFRGEPLEDMPYSEWVLEERRVLSTWRAELADRTSRDDGATTSARAAALEVLIAGEPWRRDLYDRLLGVHRAAGNGAAALAVERRKLEVCPG